MPIHRVSSSEALQTAANQARNLRTIQGRIESLHKDQTSKNSLLDDIENDPQGVADSLTDLLLRICTKSIWRIV